MPSVHSAVEDAGARGDAEQRSLSSLRYLFVDWCCFPTASQRGLARYTRPAFAAVWWSWSQGGGIWGVWIVLPYVMVLLYVLVNHITCTNNFHWVMSVWFLRIRQARLVPIDHSLRATRGTSQHSLPHVKPQVYSCTRPVHVSGVNGVLDMHTSLPSERFL